MKRMRRILPSQQEKEESENVTVAARTKSNLPSFYLGKTKYRVAECDKPMDIFQIYVQSIMNLVFGLLSNYNIQLDTDTENIMQNKAFILSYIFQAILRYNDITLPYKMKLYSSNDSFCLSEPMYFDFGETTTAEDDNLYICLYVNEELVNNILKSTSSPTITFSDEIKCSSNIFCKNSIKNCTNHFQNQDIIFRLFTIADHAATHFYQLYKTGSTDWVNHKGFGNQSATTIHSIFDVNIEFASKDFVSPLLASSIGSSNSLPTNCSTSLTSLQRSVFQPISLQTTQQLYNNSPLASLASIRGPIVDPNSVISSVF